MFKPEFDSAVANSISDVIAWHDVLSQIREISYVADFEEFKDYMDFDYFQSAAETIARTFGRTLVEYDVIEGVATRSFARVKGSYQARYDSYIYDLEKMSSSQRDFREEQIVRSFRNSMMVADVDLAHFIVAVLEPKMQKPGRFKKEEHMPPVVVKNPEALKTYFDISTPFRMGGEVRPLSEDRSLRKLTAVVEAQFLGAIHDERDYFAFLDDELGRALAAEYADKHSNDDTAESQLKEKACLYLEALRVRHVALFYAEDGDDDPDGHMDDCMDMLRRDLRELSVNLAELALFSSDWEDNHSFSKRGLSPR